MNSTELRRFSTYHFDKERKISREVIDALIDSARYAPSHYNTQPWRFIVADDSSTDYDKVLGALVEGNRVWAVNAPLLICVLHHVYSEKEKLWSIYDTGQAAFSIVSEAHRRSLNIHQMSGFAPQTIIREYNLENRGIYPIAVMAIGYSTKKYGEEQVKPRKSRGELILNSC